LKCHQALHLNPKRGRGPWTSPAQSPLTLRVGIATCSGSILPPKRSGSDEVGCVLTHQVNSTLATNVATTPQKPTSIASREHQPASPEAPIGASRRTLLKDGRQNFLARPRDTEITENNSGMPPATGDHGLGLSVSSVSQWFQMSLSMASDQRPPNNSTPVHRTGTSSAVRRRGCGRRRSWGTPGFRRSSGQAP